MRLRGGGGHAAGATVLLRSRSALLDVWRIKVMDDAEFAKSPSARPDFFARLRPSWDREYKRYPVIRLDTAP